MTRRNIQFHRIEGYELQEYGPTNERSVICSFETQRFGYLQVGFDEGGIYELTNEPDLNMLRQRDREYVEMVAGIAWRMVFDTSSRTERFV